MTYNDNKVNILTKEENQKNDKKIINGVYLSNMKYLIQVTT